LNDRKADVNTTSWLILQGWEGVQIIRRVRLYKISSILMCWWRLVWEWTQRILSVWLRLAPKIIPDKITVYWLLINPWKC